jgi:O-antigen/teichoic acid export membrane protein
MDLNARSLLAAPVVQPVARRIRLNSIWLLLARLFTQVQLVVFTLLVARGLGVEGFGQYAFVAALIFLGNVATTFGTDTLLIREVARHRTEARDQQAGGSLIAAALWIQLLLSVVWLVVVAIGANALNGQPPEVVLALKVYSLSLIPLAFFTVFTAVLRAHERMDLYLLLNVVVAFVQLGGAWWVLQRSGTLLSLVTMLNVVQLSAAVFAGMLCYKSLPTSPFHWRVTYDKFIRVVRLAWPFALLSVLAVIYQRLGVLMLSTLGTENQTGWYAAASRVIEPVKMLHFAVLGALLPALAHLAAPSTDLQSERIAGRVFRHSLLFLLSISGLAAIVIILFAQPIVTLLFGADYAESVPLVQILAMSLMPYTISASLSVRLVTQGRERLVLWATLFGLALAFVLNRWLIPAHGSTGAAWAVVGSESLLAAALLMLRR